MVNGTHIMAIVEVGLYIALINPMVFCTWKHRETGILGWFYIQTFCLVRIIGNILILKDGPTSEAATIVNSVGLSPLLLGSAGILHEARKLRHPNLTRWKELTYLINFHGLVSIAILMLVMGLIHLEDGDVTSTERMLMKVGMGMIVFSYFLLIAWAVFSYINSQTERGATAYHEGTLLLRGVTIAIPFVALRVFYGLITFSIELTSHETKKESDFLNSLGWKWGLSAIPELVVVFVYAWVGLKTRNVRKILSGKLRSKYTQVDIGASGPHDDNVPLTYMGPQQSGAYEPYSGQPQQQYAQQPYSHIPPV